MISPFSFLPLFLHFHSAPALAQHPRSALLSARLGSKVDVGTTGHPFNPFPFDPGFPIQKVTALAESLPSHSWEFGTASEALLELYNPTLSVFVQDAFPGSQHSNSPSPGTVDNIPSLNYARSKIILGGGDGRNAFADGDGAVGDPASLGVSAVLLGEFLGRNGTMYSDAARLEMSFITGGAPRYWNGAISHRVEVPELWADFVYMAPPFLAYYAITTHNYTLLQESVRQCGLYRQILHANISSSISYSGLWEHIIGPRPGTLDTGLWSTGNAWAAAGMTRVLATVINAPLPFRTPGGGDASLNDDAVQNRWRSNAMKDLGQWIGEILDGARGAPPNDGLLRNYLNDTSNSGHGFGEISGSSLLAAVAYRMAVIMPARFGSGYVAWADKIRAAVATHVEANGTASPAVNPLGWGDTVPYTLGSPEGQCFVVLMYSAWRDCVWAGKCWTKGH